MTIDKFIGAWVSPTGDIYWTNDIQSHLLAIKKIGIESQLKLIRDTLDWTQLEYSMYKYDDLPYIALKIGYIRILSYGDLIGIQYGKPIIDISLLRSIKNVLNYIISLSFIYSLFTFVVELFEQSFKLLYSLNDVINELQDMIN